MSIQIPVRLGPAELALIAQLQEAGAPAEAERLATIGLPTRKVEAFHYTDLKMLLRAVPPPAEPATSTSPPRMRIPGAFTIMIANGEVQPQGTAPAGVIVGQAAGSAVTAREDVISRLNAALAGESLTLTLESSVDPVIHLDRRTEGPAGHAAGSAKIFVAEGASATIVETFSGSDAAHLANHSTFIELGRGARLTHVTVDLSGSEATHFATSEYVIAENAYLRTLTLNAGSVLSRSQVIGRFTGAGAHADFTGLNLVGDGQHHDITLEVGHAVPGTSSKPLYKQIARGRSKAVFQGRIVVARDAQKTDAKMMMQGLMLSDEAEILSKPELEIYADDVVCGHGSTCGALDDTALFYLVSRGIPRAEAEIMLVRAFLAEVIDPIEDDELREALTGVVDDWLGT